MTHATPAGAYAHAADRWWEGDHNTATVVGGCKDIAAQLIDDYPDIQVNYTFSELLQDVYACVRVCVCVSLANFILIQVILLD